MSRIFVTILGYNRAEMVRGAIENFEETTTDAEHRRMIKTLFLCQYPLPSADENRAQLLDLGAEFGWWTTEIPNAGVMENHNKAIHDFYRMRPGDFYVCFDPDVRMQQRGWITAMIDALESDANTVFCCAARPFHDEEWCVNGHGRSITELPPRKMSLPPIRIARYKDLIAWSMGMWRGEWLAARPRHFMADNAMYGFGEHADLRLMNQHGKKWCSLVDYYDHHQGGEPLYTEWKKESAARKTSAPFDVWLRGRT